MTTDRTQEDRRHVDAQDNLRELMPDEAASVNKQGGNEVNWDQSKANGNKRRAKQKWGQLTDDELDVIDGEREELVGKIQERYDIEKEKAEKQVKEFEASCNC